MEKFKSEIVKIGEEALDFLEKDMLIFFDETAPIELKEISIVHRCLERNEKITTGDKVLIGNQSYRVTAVGEEANRTLKEMGHFTMKFNGFSRAELPGIIHVEKGEKPKIQKGMELKFICGE